MVWMAQIAIPVIASVLSKRLRKACVGRFSVDEHPEMSNEQIPATARMRLMSGFIDHSRLEPVQFFQLGAKECFACQQRTVSEPDLVRLT
jgi:hypothetical protein